MGEESSCNTEEDDIQPVMIWSEQEARTVHVSQVGVSACGATAVCNVLLALKHPFCKEDVANSIPTRLRDEGSPLAQYLLSRAVAGTMHEDLINGIRSLTNGQVSGRFFHFYPPRRVELVKWLSRWIRDGAVPVATLNLQRGNVVGPSIPDAWHHQMIFGVGSKGVYLANPVECIPESLILDQLTSDSVLLVRSSDVLTRFDDGVDLHTLMTHDDPRWAQLNVLGQVVNVQRQANTPVPAHCYHPMKPPVLIPAVYKAGITLFAPSDSPVYADIASCHELPLLNESPV